MIRRVFKVIFTAIVTGIILVTILFLSVADDSFLGVFAIIGLLVGALFAYLLRNKHIPRNPAVIFISFFSIIALLLIIYGVYGIVFDKDLITGNKYYEMAGMIPFLALGVSIPLILLSITISLFIKKREF